MNPILKRLEEGTLIRQSWERIENGKHLACLYVALAGEGKRPEDCPASLMPEWFAHLTPWIDDAGTEERWPDVVRRYAGLSERWGVLSPEDWALLELLVRRECLLSVLPYAGDSKDVVESVLGLFDRAIAGEVVSSEEWRMARAEAAAVAARAEAAAVAARAEAAAWAVAAEAAEAAGAADKLIDRILDLLEEAITTRLSQLANTPSSPVEGA